eukprot:c10339_g1_i3.p1 GENE.c10339_g1_i3~~c10339_g1_i3.p1  ORF type:complete len:875 (+),score=175.11 c10339_g1_i3:335-2959(+)
MNGGATHSHSCWMQGNEGRVIGYLSANPLGFDFVGSRLDGTRVRWSAPMHEIDQFVMVDTNAIILEWAKCQEVQIFFYLQAEKIFRQLRTLWLGAKLEQSSDGLESRVYLRHGSVFPRWYFCSCFVPMTNEAIGLFERKSVDTPIVVVPLCTVYQVLEDSFDAPGPYGLIIETIETSLRLGYLTHEERTTWVHRIRECIEIRRSTQLRHICFSTVCVVQSKPHTLICQLDFARALLRFISPTKSQEISFENVLGATCSGSSISVTFVPANPASLHPLCVTIRSASKSELEFWSYLLCGVAKQRLAFSIPKPLRAILQPIRCGFLEHWWGSGIGGGVWRRRWVEVTPFGDVAIFPSPTFEVPQVAPPLECVKIIGTKCSIGGPKERFTLHIIFPYSNDRVSFRCSTEQDTTEWHLAFSAACDESKHPLEACCEVLQNVFEDSDAQTDHAERGDCEKIQVANNQRFSEVNTAQSAPVGYRLHRALWDVMLAVAPNDQQPSDDEAPPPSPHRSGGAKSQRQIKKKAEGFVVVNQSSRGGAVRTGEGSDNDEFMLIPSAQTVENWMPLVHEWGGSDNEDDKESAVAVTDAPPRYADPPNRNSKSGEHEDDQGDQNEIAVIGVRHHGNGGWNSDSEGETNNNNNNNHSNNKKSNDNDSNNDDDNDGDNQDVDDDDDSNPEQAESEQDSDSDNDDNDNFWNVIVLNKGSNRHASDDRNGVTGVALRATPMFHQPSDRSVLLSALRPNFRRDPPTDIFAQLDADANSFCFTPLPPTAQSTTQLSRQFPPKDTASPMTKFQNHPSFGAVVKQRLVARSSKQADEYSQILSSILEKKAVRMERRIFRTWRGRVGWGWVRHAHATTSKQVAVINTPGDWDHVVV